MSRKAVAPGDLILWYTDGYTEAANPAGELFGDRRLQRLLRSPAAQGDPDVVLTRLLDAVTVHRGGLALADDVTLVVARVQPGDGLDVQRPRSGEILVAVPRRP
ncbi:MAG: SpoIIE family protein phosphatase [Myxococcales bacterium]|nr:SpoIIE family protein phosphatase [Myxococcales bacterium]